MSHLGCSQKYGPLLVLDYIAAANISGYQTGTISLGITPFVGKEAIGTEIIANTIVLDSMYNYGTDDIDPKS